MRESLPGLALSVLFLAPMASGPVSAQTPAEPALLAVAPACTLPLSAVTFAFIDDKRRRECTRHSDCSAGYRCDQDGRCERRPIGRPGRPPARPPCNRGTFIPSCGEEAGGNLRTRQDDCLTEFYAARGPDHENILNDLAACRRMASPWQVQACVALVILKFGASVVTNEIAARDARDKCYADAEDLYEPEFEECIAKGLKTC